MGFTLRAATDLFAAKVNFELEFPTQPSLPVLRLRAESVFSRELDTRRPPECPREPFRIDRMEVFDLALGQWVELSSSSQLTPGCQCYIFQPSNQWRNDAQGGLPPAVKPPHLSGGLPPGAAFPWWLGLFPPPNPVAVPGSGYTPAPAMLEHLDAIDSRGSAAARASSPRRRAQSSSPARLIASFGSPPRGVLLEGGNGGELVGTTHAEGGAADEGPGGGRSSPDGGAHQGRTWQVPKKLPGMHGRLYRVVLEPRGRPADRRELMDLWAQPGWRGGRLQEGHITERLTVRDNTNDKELGIALVQTRTAADTPAWLYVVALGVYPVAFEGKPERIHRYEAAVCQALIHGIDKVAAHLGCGSRIATDFWEETSTTPRPGFRTDYQCRLLWRLGFTTDPSVLPAVIKKRFDAAWGQDPGNLFPEPAAVPPMVPGAADGVWAYRHDRCLPSVVGRPGEEAPDPRIWVLRLMEYAERLFGRRHHRGEGPQTFTDLPEKEKRRWLSLVAYDHCVPQPDEQRADPSAQPAAAASGDEVAVHSVGSGGAAGRVAQRKRPRKRFAQFADKERVCKADAPPAAAAPAAGASACGEGATATAPPAAGAAAPGSSAVQPQRGQCELRSRPSTPLTPGSLKGPARPCQAGRTALSDSQGSTALPDSQGSSALPDSQEVHAVSTAQQPRMCTLSHARNYAPRVVPHTDSEHGYWTRDGAQVPRGSRGGAGAARERGPEAKQAGWRFVETPAPDPQAAELTSEMMQTLSLAAVARQEYQRARCLQWENLIHQLGPRSARRVRQQGSDDPPFAGPPIECPLCAGLGFVPTLVGDGDGQAGYRLAGTTTDRRTSVRGLVRLDEAVRDMYGNVDDDAEHDASDLLKAYGDQERAIGKSQLRQWLQQAARQEHSLSDFQVPLRPDRLEKEETERRRHHYFEYQRKLLGKPAWAGRELPSCYADLGVAPGDHESARVLAGALGIDASTLSPGGHDAIEADHYQTYGPPKLFVPAPEFTLSGSREFDKEERQDIADALERRLRGGADKKVDASGDESESTEQDVDVAAMQAKALAGAPRDEAHRRVLPAAAGPDEEAPGPTEGRTRSQRTKAQVLAMPCKVCQPHKAGSRGQQRLQGLRPAVICPSIPASMVLDRLPDEVFLSYEEWMQRQLPGYEKAAASVQQVAKHASAEQQPEKQVTHKRKKPKKKRK